jgi:site-specific DNA recombinase
LETTLVSRKKKNQSSESQRTVVSVQTAMQATSYEAQVEHYTEYIQKNPDWEFAGIYADDGISGTNTKKREEFNHMIDDCKAGNIDMIITKSISRFARNTLDCLKYIRQLKDMNIPVLFEKESINTMDAKGEVLITIMASLAQQESQSLSQNVKMGLKYRYQQGKVQINHNRFLGYTKDADGNLIIDPEQAEIVKRIYREYLEGLSMDKIAAGLERDGIITGAGGKRWHTSTINKILRNEKYIGDALLQKTYTTDFLNKTRVKNNGLVPQYYVEGNHEAIIPKEIYLQVQEELVRRRVVKTSANGKKRSYSCNHCFSQIVICGECGEMFRRLHWNIVELNLSSGAASAGWNLPDWNATPEPLTSWSFRMLSSRQSTRCLETKVAIRHSYSSTLPQSSELRRQLLSRTSMKS